jgi:hypothetical protein
MHLQQFRDVELCGAHSHVLSNVPHYDTFFLQNYYNNLGLVYSTRNGTNLWCGI